MNKAIVERNTVREIVESEKSDILFVQWQLLSTKVNFNYDNVVIKRRKVEAKITNKMKKKSIGHLIASEQSENKADMLYEVNNSVKAANISLQILKSAGIKDECVLAVRERNSEGSWVYKVIFPEDVNKKFIAW